MTLEKVAGAWVCRSSFDERLVPKAAGFTWDKVVPRAWATRDPMVAVKLRVHATGEVLAELDALADRHQAAVAASRAVTADVSIPAPAGLSYMPFQRAGIAYALGKAGVLIADEMGLGKTIQAIGVINADETIQRVLVICPASLKINWRKELTRWLARTLTVGIADGKGWPKSQVVIVNYDVLKKWWERVAETAWDLLVVDEAHYLKNPKAQRTVEVLGKHDRDKAKARPAIQARRRVFLTGTPIVNRPIEAWGLVSSLAPEAFPSFWRYAQRYCGARQDGYGWDFSGASNLGELQELLRGSCMVRRLKSEVLTELPAKRRQVVELDVNGDAVAVLRREREAMAAIQDRMERLQADVELARAGADEEGYRAAVRALGAGVTAAFSELSVVRHETALAKLPAVIEHLQNTDEKVVVFAHHHDVVEAIAREFAGEVAVVYGETTLVHRDEAVTRFQTDPACRVFVGSIGAAGVGLTLTAASHVVFAELDWVPGNMSQAEDRCHRIGQRESVLVQHLVLADSLDAHMANVLVGKQEVIDAALNSGDDEASILLREPVVPVMPGRAGGALAAISSRRKELDAVAASMTAEQVEAVHGCLRILAAMDADHARDENGVGFNKVDTLIGCDLAMRRSLTPRQAALGRKLVRKYGRQLPADLLHRAVGTTGDAKGGQ